MRRIFTSFIALGCLMAISTRSISQCFAPAAPPATPTYTFDASAEGFTGDFTFNNGPDRLESSPFSAGTIKVLKSPTFLFPNSLTNLDFSFTLAGTANVTAYDIDVIYFTGGQFDTVHLCTGGALANNTYNVSILASTLTAVIGQRFQILLTFTITGSSNQIIAIDNFYVNVPESQIVLPVKISTFEARSISGAATLTWKVAAEENVTGYDVERSADGRSFSKIGFVPATGQSTYSFVDSKPLSTSYYRIKSVEADGRYTLSTIASLKGGKSSIVLRAFPMPAISDVTIQHGTAVRGSQISISAEDGRIIKTVVPSIGTQQTIVDFSSAKPGLYIIRFNNANGEVESLKLVKQ